MNARQISPSLPDQPSSIRLYAGGNPVSVPKPVLWLIDGFPAEILVWTAEEWATLDPPPGDAQLYANGCRAALRIS